MMLNTKPGCVSSDERRVACGRLSAPQLIMSPSMDVPELHYHIKYVEEMISRARLSITQCWKILRIVELLSYFMFRI